MQGPCVTATLEHVTSDTLPPSLPPTSSTPEVPSTVRNPWGRLLMLFTIVGTALVAAGLCVAFLVPRQSGPTYALFPLEQVPVGQAQPFRPFNMGGNAQGARYQMFIVRTSEAGEILALFSRDPHPANDHCAVVPAAVTEPGVRSPNSTPMATPTPAAPTVATTAPAQINGFRSPCLGSTYSLTGRALFGPAPRGLDRFETRLEANLVRIDTSKLVLGPCREGTAPGAMCSTPDDEKTEKVNWPGN
jgi:hypothetical protein